MSPRWPLVLLFLIIQLLLLPFLSPSNANQDQQVEESGGQRQEGGETIPSGGIQAQHRHRWRRAPAVWGEPAPDYSMAALDHSTHLYLYALLFVDLKTSDHYRREHGLVKREVMRLAREANNYFYQINLRLIVVDVLETFRDDLSLYTFEQYRNQRMAQLPFHNFAVLITYRYAGGLAFVGGMCSPKSVMLAGFYPHNPEAMGSIFFHEVAHLIGVPHRPANESLEVPNCICPRQSTRPIGGGGAQQPRPTTSAGEPVSKSSLILDGHSQSSGCLKIPGFDQDCTLQLMVNLAQRTRCLARERPAQDLRSLPLCGNGLREGNEQCDCGLANKCAEWNCEPYTCSRRWQLWKIWSLAIVLCLVFACPLLLYAWLRQNARLPSSLPASIFGPAKRSGRRLFFARLPLMGGPQCTGKHSTKLAATASFQLPRTIRGVGNGNGILRGSHPTLLGTSLLPLRTIWERLKRRIWRRRADKASSIASNSSSQVRRPLRPPPPPPPLLIRSPRSTLSRPNKPPPPLPPLSTSTKLIIRPKTMPPEPPQKRPTTTMVSEDEDEDEWDDYCE